jgi:hypothetical protein
MKCRAKMATRRLESEKVVEVMEMTWELSEDVQWQCRDGRHITGR